MASPSRPFRLQRAKTPKHNGSEPVVNEAKLVRAIQDLDETWKSRKRRHLSPTNYSADARHYFVPSRLSDSQREALCFLLEIASYFDDPGLLIKSKLETICAARVLGCLKRFITSCVEVEAPIGECCEQKCEQRLIHLTLLCILFHMCRKPQVACNVVKEELHTSLIKMCKTSEMANLGINTEKHTRKTLVPNAQTGRAFDPLDLMISIDPFDWCYHSLCTSLIKEDCHVFFAPVGIRSLSCLLQGIALPVDEVSAFEQQKMASRKIRDTTTKCQKLPSIFTFPQLHLDTDATKAQISSTRKHERRLAPICCFDCSDQTGQQNLNALWSVVLNESSRTHLALRCLIALAIHLPQLSPESKSLFREASWLTRTLDKLTRQPELSPDRATSSEPSFLPSTGKANGSETLPELVSCASFQSVAIQPHTLRRLALSLLTSFTEQQDSSRSVAMPKKKQPPPRSSKMLAPIFQKQRCKPEENCSLKVDRVRQSSKPQPLLQRLQTAKENAYSEYSQWKNANTLENQRSRADHAHRRLELRNMCANVESLRNHLMGSLGVLCSGRQHPDPQQPFSDWMKSLPTIETMQRERQYQQEMRQRQTLEQQYQREAIRRRERDECTLMQASDYNVPKESELSVLQEKHGQFLRMQAEMRELLHRDSLNNVNQVATKPSTKGAKMTTKREKLELEERQRLLQLEEHKREARELERMQREDLYYLERILKAKTKAKEEQDKREKNGAPQINALEEQRQRIGRMRFLDEEKRIAERESNKMRVEDLFGRQIRFQVAELAKEELRDEWRGRKSMQAEEQDSRTSWLLLNRAAIQQQQQELKQQRAQERKLKRLQQREEEQIKAAWVESWDEGGNKYYYNSITGVSQWELPST